MGSVPRTRRAAPLQRPHDECCHHSPPALQLSRSEGRRDGKMVSPCIPELCSGLRAPGGGRALRMFAEGAPGSTCPRSREHPQQPRPSRVPPPMRRPRSLLRDSPQAQPGPLGRFESSCGRRSSADPGPLSSSVPTACGLTTGPRPGRRGGRAGLPPARAPPKPPLARVLRVRTSPRGELGAWPLPAARRPPPAGSGRPLLGPGVQPRPPGRRSAAPRPPPPPRPSVPRPPSPAALPGHRAGPAAQSH